MSGRRLRLQAKPNLKPAARVAQTTDELKGTSAEPQLISNDDHTSQDEGPAKDLSHGASEGPEKILGPPKEVENNSIEINIEFSPNEKSKKFNHPISKLKLLSPKLNESVEILPPPVVVKPVAIKLLSPKKNALDAANAKESGVSVTVVQAPSSEAKSSKVPEQPPQPKAKRSRRISNSQELDRSSFTMKDLIYWNPQNNTGLKYDDEPSTSAPTSTADNNKKLTKANEVNESQPAAPQIRVNADGTLVIDETSLTITQTRQTTEFETVCETNSSRTTQLNQYSFRRNPVLKSRSWNETETEKFYRILKMTGTDFSLMAEYFPRRCRAGLKNKFNRECRDNPDKIYHAMTKGSCALRVPRRLKKLEREKRSKVDNERKNSDGGHSPSKDGGAGTEPHSGSENDEILSPDTFEKPTRSGRIPKPSKKAEIQIKHYKSYNKSRIAKRKKLLLEHFTSDDDDFPGGGGEPQRRLPKVVIKEMPKTSLPVDDGSAPGPSAFPRYVPSSQAGDQTILDAGNKQILLVREKAKEAGQPDLVHIYMVDPASSEPSNNNEDGDIDSQQQQLVIHSNTPKPIVTAADQHLMESDHEDDIIEIDL